MSIKLKEFSRSFFHGTKANLKLGDLLAANYNSNYGQKTLAKYVYFTSNLSAAIWGAELASGNGLGRIYVVEPTGYFEDDPNLTDKKFPGNPTNSFRSQEPLEVVGEVVGWQGHSIEEIRIRKENLEKALQSGSAKIIED